MLILCNQREWLLYAPREAPDQRHAGLGRAGFRPAALLGQRPRLQGVGRVPPSGGPHLAEEGVDALAQLLRLGRQVARGALDGAGRLAGGGRGFRDACYVRRHFLEVLV